MISHSVIQIINTGQAGVDIGALIGAKRSNIATGGTARKDYMTHGGAKVSELMELGLLACDSINETQCISSNIKQAQACLFLTAKKHSVYHDFIVPLLNEYNLPFLALDIYDSKSLERATNFLTTINPSNLFVTGDSNRLTPKIAFKTAIFVQTLLSQK